MYLWTMFSLRQINKGDLYWKREKLIKPCGAWFAVECIQRHRDGYGQSHWSYL
jgi:hypothetical protein